MKYLATSAAIVLALASTGNAQDASQWAGVYVGLGAANNSGDMTYSDGGAYDLDGDTKGVILGYNHASGPWVYGGEIAYSAGKVEEVNNPGFYLDPMTDLKARVGYATGKLLVYGTIGATFTRWTESSSTFDGHGLLYGVGADYLVSQHVFIGGEVVARDIKADWNAFGGTLDANVTTFTLRAGMKF